jgi:hypothetical protein
VALSPLVADGLACGSVTLLLLGLVVAGLAMTSERPLLGGGLVGLVTASKPVAVSALAVLAMPDRGGRLPARRLLAASAAVAAAMAWLLIGFEHLPSMASRAGGLPGALTNVSLPRVLYALGVPVHPVITFGVLTAAGAALAWWRRPLDRQRLAIATSTSLLALPINNPSTLLYSLPAQAVALERAVARLRSAGAAPRRRALAELALVVGAVASVHGAMGVAAVGELSLPLQGLVTLIPLAAVAGLTLYGTMGEAEADRGMTGERGRAVAASAPPATSPAA